MLALSMLVITALVGTRDLGQEVYIGLTKADIGRGLVAGLCVAFISIIADRIIKAGSNKLIIHIIKVADKIPTVLAETKPNKKRATDPLTPISVIAIVGITEIINSITVVKIIESIYETFTPKTCNKIKN